MFEAYNSSLEAAIGTCSGSFQIIRSSAFFWAQEVQDYLKASLRKLHLKLVTITQITGLVSFYDCLSFCQVMLHKPVQLHKYPKNTTTFFQTPII